MSPCASTQSSPTFFPSPREAAAMAETVPTEMEWSPPSTRGKCPLRDDPLHLGADLTGGAGDLREVAGADVARP